MSRTVLVAVAATLISLSPSVSRGGNFLPFTWRSAEHLALGDSGVASAEHKAALFYNPAALDTINPRRRKLSMVNPTFEMGHNFNEIKTYLERISDIDENMTDDQILGILGSMADFQLTFKASNLMDYFTRMGGVGILFQATGAAKTWQDGNIVNLGILNAADAGVIAARTWPGFSTVMNHRFLDINIGYAGKIVRRYALIDRMSNNRWVTTSMSDYYADDSDNRFTFKSGARVGMDVGILARIRNRHNSAVGVHVRDILTTQFPDELGQVLPNVRAGFSTYLENRSLGAGELKLNLDIANIFTSMKFSRRIHFGVEAKGNRWTTWRLGLNGGVPTYGVSIQTGASLLITLLSHGEILSGPGDEDFHYRNNAISLDLTF